MNDEPSLFGDEPTPDTPIAPVITPIAEWQIDLLRKALDARGLTTMSVRRSAIEAAAGRPVESLRTLTHDEGCRYFSSRPGTCFGASRKSAWDDRDEDTWIDQFLTVRTSGSSLAE